jgi:hypothetical protein
VRQQVRSQELMSLKTRWPTLKAKRRCGSSWFVCVKERCSLCFARTCWTPDELALPAVIGDGKDDDVAPSVDGE